MLANIADWENRLEEIAFHAVPGNRVRALSLLRDIAQVKVSLRRLSGLSEDE